MTGPADAVRNHARETADRGMKVATIPPNAADTADLLGALYRADRKPQAGRPGTSIIHASSFCHTPKCARMLVLAKALREAGATFTEPHMGAMPIVWSIGRAIEDHVRRALLDDPGFRARAYGVWRCRCRAVETRGHISARPPVCAQCKTPADSYAEITLHDPDSGVSGNPDMIFKEPGDSQFYSVLEIKSIADNDEGGRGYGFSALESPLPTHVEQGAHYVRLLRVNGIPAVRKPTILYVNKRFTLRGWYKALIPSDRMQGQAEQDVASAIAAAKDHVNALRSGALPDKIPLCAQNKDAEKKRCPSWAECMAHA